MLIMKRQAGNVTLHVRGRDIEEAEKPIQFTKDADVRSSARRRKFDVLMNDRVYWTCFEMPGSP
jgi:hypothetical protein